MDAARSPACAPAPPPPTVPAPRAAGPQGTPPTAVLPTLDNATSTHGGYGPPRPRRPRANGTRPRAHRPDRLYVSFFRRLPDPEGLAYWTEVIDNGASIDDVRQWFAGSAEFQGRYGGLDQSAFTKTVHDNFLCRTPEGEAETYWNQLLADQVIDQFTMLELVLSSAEYTARYR